MYNIIQYIKYDIMLLKRCFASRLHGHSKCVF